MTSGELHQISMTEDESRLRWGFLESLDAPTAVVSGRMELVYLNGPAREIMGETWFGRRCFEIFPTVDKLCAFCCSTIDAVRETQEIVYGEEILRATDGRLRELRVAVIPLEEIRGPRASALLLFLPKEASAASLQQAASELWSDVKGRFAEP